MNLKLLGIDGVEVTRRIRNIDGNANVYGFTAYFDTKCYRTEGCRSKSSDWKTSGL